MAEHVGTRSWRGTLAGLIWIGSWTAVLLFVHAPWRDLGGLVSEWLRWLERLVLLSGVVVGAAAGATARGIGRVANAACYARRLRWCLYPAGASTAVLLAALAILDRDDPIGVVLAGFVAYWAGLDLTLGAVPLMQGRFFDRLSERSRSSG